MGCDMNGCFPGQSRGYKSPNRPDQSWAIMQAEAAKMEELKKNPKFSITGKPGNFKRSWQDSLGAPPVNGSTNDWRWIMRWRGARVPARSSGSERIQFSHSDQCTVSWCPSLVSLVLA